MVSQTPQRPTIANADVHTRKRSPPSPLPFQHIGTIQGTVPIPLVINPAGIPAFQAVITKLEQMKRKAMLRRIAFEGYAKAVEAFVRNSPDKQKKFAQEIQEGILAYLNQYLFGTAAAKQLSKTFYAGALKTPNTSTINANRHQTHRPAKTRRLTKTKWGTQNHGPADGPTADSRQPDAKEPKEKNGPSHLRPGRTRDASSPRSALLYPGGHYEGLYDLILKGSNAALIYKATRCIILERMEKWHTYRLAHTPSILTGLLGNRLVIADVVTEEAEIQTGVRPVNCYNTGTSGSTSVWFISFKEEVRSFTLFGSSGHFKLLERKKSIELHNPGYQEYYNLLTCRAVRRCNNYSAAISKYQGVSGAAYTALPKYTGCYGPFPAGHKHYTATPKRADGKIVRLTASQLGEIRCQQTAIRKACKLAAKSQQERGPKSGVQVVIPTLGARIAVYEAADQQSRRVKRKTAPTGSLNLVELSKRSVYAVSDDEASPTLSLAFEEGADVVCVQEPSVYSGTRTQNHPAYECYAPVDAWERILTAERKAERPRAMSYTQKAANLITQQRRNGDDRDIVWLEVNGFHIVNVYREPSTRRIIDYITSIQVPPNFLIGGDFNAKHDMFEPGLGSSNQGASLAAWSLSSGADFIGEPGEPIHRVGHTIDLTFSNILFAEIMVRHDLDCGSDYFIFVTLLPGRGQGADGNAGYRATEANLPRRHRCTFDYSLPECDQGSREALTGYGQIGALVDAGYASARRQAAPEQERKRRDILSTIQNVKSDYWRWVIDSAADDADLYKVVGWHKLALSFKAPPLIVNGVSIESTKEKTEALLEKVLHRYDDSDDLEYDPLKAEGRRPILPWTTAISLEEVEKSVIGVSSTSPGANRITKATPANRLVPGRPQGYDPAREHIHHRIEDAMQNPTGFAAIPDSVIRWGAENKVAFTPEKLETIHLSRKRNTDAFSIRVSPELTIMSVTAVGDEQPALRWLGVSIDRKLSFKRHVAERLTKALKVARHIKGLVGVRFGPPAASLRKAVVTCVQSSLLYGLEVWYGGRRKPSASHGYNATGWTDPTEGSTKKAAAEQFNTWWSQLSDNTITVFSDSSEQYKDNAKSGAINSISHVFDAEAIEALKGLQCALEILRPLDKHIWMCINSTSVIWCIQANASNTSQWAFLECHALIDQFKVGIRWSPGHMGIEGNETADELADAGANEGRMDDDRSAEPTISGIGTTARALADAATSDWWSRCLTELSASYRKWGLGYSIAEPPEFRLPRTLLHRLLAARTAYGDFAQYHRRFGHTDAELNCLCGYAKTPEHLVFCEISQRKFHAWPAKPERPPSRPKRRTEVVPNRATAYRDKTAIL
ncbi:hypothetical protein DID88_000013 [Monilinia fructigena]|uniref:RNase H type-1 domain-containing protein n=1 Tax=Monilinia fructigena TaxID=38457 RepID=A0A395ILI2_9HELO|nr:hypothetical protein DID88_000013 [Monilinia fructigena]